MIVEAVRTRANLAPIIPISYGSLPTASRDQPVRKATKGPIAAPLFQRPAMIGKQTYGPPGVKPPAKVPTKSPPQR